MDRNAVRLAGVARRCSRSGGNAASARRMLEAMSLGGSLDILMAFWRMDSGMILALGGATGFAGKRAGGSGRAECWQMDWFQAPILARAVSVSTSCRPAQAVAQHKPSPSASRRPSRVPPSPCQAGAAPRNAPPAARR